MNNLFPIPVLLCVALLLHGRICESQSTSSSGKCKNPIILDVTSVAGSPQFRLNGKSSRVYPLTEMANELSQCKIERTVDVILDYRVSLADFLGSVPSKLQVGSVRYFIRTETSLVEVSIVSYDARIPKE